MPSGPGLHFAAIALGVALLDKRAPALRARMKKIALRSVRASV
jgi:hypothetical protein